MPPIKNLGSTHTGRQLGRLREMYHLYREEFLALGEAYPVGEESMLRAFRRGLIAWYEVVVWRGEAALATSDHDFLMQAGQYFLLHLDREHLGVEWPEAPPAHPLYEYLPRPIILTDHQRAMRHQFEEMGETCQSILLLAYYHRLDAATITKAFGWHGGAGEGATRIRQCRQQAREWLFQAGLLPSESRLDVELDLIDRYLLGNLSGQERWDLDARREREDFRQTLLLEEEWLEAVRTAGRRELHELLMAEEERYVAISRTPRIPRSTWTRWAAMLALVLVTLAVWLWYNREYPDQGWPALAESAFAPYPNLIAPSGGTDSANLALERAFLPYERQQWAQAEAELEPLLPDYPQLRLYLGISALGQGYGSRAARWMEGIRPGDPFHEPAQWYLALAFLREGQVEPARALLFRIRDTPRHPYRMGAEELLERL